MANNKIDARQSRLVPAQAMIGSASGDTLDTIFPKINDELAKLFEDRNVFLVGGGSIAVDTAGSSVTFSSALSLHLNSLVAGGSPTIVDLTATTRAFSADGRMLYAVVNRTAGTAVVTADSATLSAVTSANQEVFLIAKRVGTTIYFRNGQTFAAGMSGQLGRVGVTLDSEFKIADATDPTKQLAFDAAGTASTSTTITTSQTTNKVITLPDATDTLVGKATTDILTNKTLQFLQQAVATDSTTTGSNTTLAAFTTGIVRITNGSLVSLSGIPAGLSGQQIVVENKTGNQISINNEEATATAANRIQTGSGSNIPMPNNTTFILTYDTTSSRWQLTGGSGSGSGSGGFKNYITNPDAEADTTGWATYADVAGTSPVDGTAGSPTLTFTRTTSSPLSDLASFLITKDAANRQGNGVSFDFTVDASSKAKVMQIGFDYIVASGTFVAGNPADRTSAGDSDITVWIYDVTNAVLIQPSTYRLFSNSSTIADRFTANFQTASNSTSYRLIMHCATTSAAAYTVKVDTVSVSPTTYVYGTPITDWTSYTPTYGSGYGTVSTSNMKYRRVGDSIEVKGTFVTGTLTSANGTISLPPGLSIDTSKQVATEPVGRIIRSVSSNTLMYFTALAQTGSSTTAIYQGGPLAINNAVGPFSAVTMSSVGGNGETMDVDFRVPVSGWSSSVQMSDSADTRVIAASYYRTTTQSYANSTFTTINFDGKLVDTHSTMSAGSYTIPVTGIYKLFCHVLWAASPGSQSIIQVSKNGSTSGIASNGRIYDSDTNLKNMSGSIMLDLKTGDVITIQAYQSSGGSINLTTAEMSIERISGPSVIAATEEISAYGTAGDGQSISNSTNTVLTLVTAFDTHGSVSGNVITIPSTGRYMYQATIQYAANTTGVRQLWCERSTDGGSNWTTVTLDTIPAAASSGTKVTTEKIFNFNAGDKIRFLTWQNSGSSITITSSIHQQRFNFFKLK